MTVTEDWVAWHGRYDDDAALWRRLAIVRRCIRDLLDRAPQGPITVISVCAGDGRDLLGVLADHPRAPDVRARLVQLDPGLADRARSAVAGIGGVIEAVTADAGVTDAHAGAVPADQVLICGVFGNICDPAVERTIGSLPMLCARGGTVIWARHRREPDLAPSIRGWLAEAGFAEVAFIPVQGSAATMGVARNERGSRPLQRSLRLFESDPPRGAHSVRGRADRLAHGGGRVRCPTRGLR